MYSRIRNISLAATALSLAISAAARAQSIEQAVFADCQRDTGTAGAFQHCALKLERARLVRANSGAVISTRGFLNPIALTQFVAGDSALTLARTYERRSRLGMRMEVIGAIFAASAVVASRICSNDDCGSRQRVNGSVIAGAAVFAIGVPIQVRARHQGRMAVSLYNASLKH